MIYIDTAFWNSESQSGCFDFDCSLLRLVLVPELLDVTLGVEVDDDHDCDDDDDPGHVVEDELCPVTELLDVTLGVDDDDELDHAAAAEDDDELVPGVPSLLKLSGPHTDSTSRPTFHFSGIRLLGMA